jgi:large subunit ribosomal protein L4
MKLQVFDRSGTDTGRAVELDEAVFGIEPNDHVIWLDVKAVQAHGRQGTHKTKERGEVNYSRRKLYRQKGTGHARAGDRKSPVRVGGGTIFGPKPHEYNIGVNKKTRRLARRSALAYKLQGDALRILEDFNLDAPRTKDVAEILRALELNGRKVLFLTADHNDPFYRSARNIPKVNVLRATDASTVDLMNAQIVVLQEGAIETLTENLRPRAKAAQVVEEAGVAEPETTQTEE